MSDSEAPSGGRGRDIWTRLMVDPIADPVARKISGWPGVTPSRVTGGAALAAVASATCFASGLLRVGGLLFMLRFFLDCVDGKVARQQGSSSIRGAALDIAADVAGIGLNIAALSWYLAENEELPYAVGLLLLSAVVFYNWVLAYRKHLGERAGVGDGGAGQVHSSVVGLRSWLALCRRLGMHPVPWAVEVEILALGLIPIFLSPRWVGFGLSFALAFYVLACAINLRRVVHIAGVLDEQQGAASAQSGGHGG
jgi:phosphatidylglycerophosphate synthase